MNMDLKVYLTAILFPVIVSDAYDTCDYPTQTDHSWYRKCEPGSFVSHIHSTYRPAARDRMWLVCCRRVTSHKLPFTCTKWTGYINKYGADFNHRCPPNHFLSGLGSRHSYAIKDRRFRFRCCSSESIRLKNCQETQSLNDFGEELNFNVSAGHVLTSFRSEFNEFMSDRQYSATVCKVMKKASP